MAERAAAGQKTTNVKPPKEEPMLHLKLRRAFIIDGVRYRRVHGGTTAIPARYKDKLPTYLKEQMKD